MICGQKLKVQYLSIKENKILEIAICADWFDQVSINHLLFPFQRKCPFQSSWTVETGETRWALRPMHIIHQLIQTFLCNPHLIRWSWIYFPPWSFTMKLTWKIKCNPSYYNSLGVSFLVSGRMLRRHDTCSQQLAGLSPLLQTTVISLNRCKICHEGHEPGSCKLFFGLG